MRMVIRIVFLEIHVIMNISVRAYTSRERGEEV